ncbi:hypothetical protein LTR70_000866 [Exophiala xenobiotica]|uniref:BTB domain-containing protein n=1 Tax=Lithohypha guttulata TaxID=1690604 RepID=A0ABR0KK88_9EURO|nr:hypothetical protein LTR24_001640 [Lithohypha guttulata]KAK5329030.1 hypothetical protein LTR70_000866 [Exophiala xenobiotica]
MARCISNLLQHRIALPEYDSPARRRKAHHRRLRRLPIAMNHYQQIPRLDHLSSLISRFTQGEIITILVGSKRKRFHIYKDLLRAKSPYFAASLKYCWNGDMDEVYLNEDANAFGRFTNWMFRDTIPVVDLGSPEGLAAITAFYKAGRLLTCRRPSKPDHGCYLEVPQRQHVGRQFLLLILPARAESTNHATLQIVLT